MRAAVGVEPALNAAIKKTLDLASERLSVLETNVSSELRNLTGSGASNVVNFRMPRAWSSVRNGQKADIALFVFDQSYSDRPSVLVSNDNFPPRGLRRLFPFFGVCDARPLDPNSCHCLRLR
jgi:hypothetical protein